MFDSSSLFAPEDAKDGRFTVNAAARSSTWTKAFDLNYEGLSEHNYQAYTYDLPFSNNTRDEVKTFSFRLTFDTPIFLLSGWNGTVEIHQLRDGGERVSAIPDLREYDPADYPVETVTVDGEALIPLHRGTT